MRGKKDKRLIYSVRLCMFRCMVLLLAMLASVMIYHNTAEAKKSVRASLPAISVKVGGRIQISFRTSEVTCSISDPLVASVDLDGVITGKKPGKVLIKVKRKGYKTKELSLRVVKRTGKPVSLPVTFAEVSRKEKKGDIYITNHSQKGKIKKIIYYYSQKVQVEKQSASVSGQVVEASEDAKEAPEETSQKTCRITVTALNIAAGKTVRTVRQGDNELSSGSVSSLKLEKIELYTGSALYVYEPQKGTYSLKWGTKDVKPPVITGLVKGKSYTGEGDFYRVYYSDKKEDYNFKRFVSAEDDRDGKVKLQVDTSKVNWEEEGIYQIHYYAVDSAGNESSSWAAVWVLKPDSAEAAADRVLNRITKKGWSNTRKARAIYNYIRRHCSYVYNAAHTPWRSAALQALRYQSGDCYTYYAVSRLLLTRAGIPNVMIRRYPTPGGQRHFWNLAYVHGGWYHFDTTPRTKNARFCLWTDAQLWAYSSGYTFRFRKELYPKRAKKRI